MSKNDDINAALFEHETQWREIEQGVSARYPQEAATLNALLAARRQSVQRAQEVEAEGRPLSTFALLLKTWFLQRQINRILGKLNAAEAEA